jgi:hypothetical protein
MGHRHQRGVMPSHLITNGCSFRPSVRQHNLFEYSLSQSSNHVFRITLDPHPLNCPFHPLLFSIFRREVAPLY